MSLILDILLFLAIVTMLVALIVWINRVDDRQTHTEAAPRRASAGPPPAPKRPAPKRPATVMTDRPIHPSRDELRRSSRLNGPSLS